MTLEELLKITAQPRNPGDIATAEAHWRDILSRHPDHPGAVHMLGVVAMHSGNHQAAIQLINRALQLKPGMVDAMGNLGVAYKNVGRTDEAAAILRQVLELRPDYAEAACNLGAIHSDRHQWQAAIDYYNCAISINPNLASAHQNLGTALLNTKKFNEALASFQRAVALDPINNAHHHNLGSAYAELGEIDKAMDAYQRSLELNPAFAESQCDMAKALKNSGRFVEAAESFTRLMQMRPLDKWTYWVFNEIGEQLEMMGTPTAPVVVDDALPPLPYIGDKVVLLNCDRKARDQLRAAGLHSGYCINPATGADRWLSTFAFANLPLSVMSERVLPWMDWMRNEAAMSGRTFTLWLPNMPPAFADILRNAAGEDLLEVSGASAAEIHARLAQHARPEPDTDGKFFAIVSIRNGGLELLPHWLEHYTRLGVHEILLGIFDDVAPESRQQIDALAERFKFRRFTQRWTDAVEEDQYAHRYTAARHAGARPGTWLLHTDLDEFHEYPAPLCEIGKAAAEKNIQAVYGHLADRVAADGLLPSVRPEPSLSEQFPIECRLTGHILKAGTQKVMLCTYRMRVSPGHHNATLAPTEKPPLGKAEDYRVAHYKWHGELIGRMRWGLKERNASDVWKEECLRFLSWFDAHKGRIEFMDPELKAVNRAAK